MRQVLTLPTDLLTVLNKYSDWVSQNPPDVNLPNWRTKGKFKRENRSEYAASVECLKSGKVQDHDGFPPDSFGYDLNEPTLRVKITNTKLPPNIHQFISVFSFGISASKPENPF